MRVLLVRPMARNAVGGFAPIECEPLELEYLLSACREQGIEAEIYDAVTEHRRLSDVLASFRPDAVAVTGYLTQEREMARCAAQVKKYFPRCLVVLGGVHVQLCYERLKWETVDVLFRSEDVRALVWLLKKLEAGESWEDIPGACVRTAEGWRETAYVPADPEKLPLPDRSFWRKNARWYHYLDLPRLGTVKTAFSCPQACSFCYGTLLHGGRYQARPVSSVLDELESMEAKHIFIVDSDFLVSEERLRLLLAGLKERNIRKTFICYGRADFIAGHPELMEELCQAGFLWYLVGIEAVEDQRLAGWNKGTTAAVNDACLEVLKRCGARCIALLIADLSFQPEDFDALYRWVKEKKLRYASVQVLTPLPGTAFFRAREGELTETDFFQFDLAHPVLPPARMSGKAFLRRYRMLLTQLYLLGRLRGAYRFVTPGYLLRVLCRWHRWRKLLS